MFAVNIRIVSEFVLLEDFKFTQITREHILTNLPSILSANNKKLLIIAPRKFNLLEMWRKWPKTLSRYINWKISCVTLSRTRKKWKTIMTNFGRFEIYFTSERNDPNGGFKQTVLHQGFRKAVTISYLKIRRPVCLLL